MNKGQLEDVFYCLMKGCYTEFELLPVHVHALFLVHLIEDTYMPGSSGGADTRQRTPDVGASPARELEERVRAAFFGIDPARPASLQPHEIHRRDHHKCIRIIYNSCKVASSVHCILRLHISFSIGSDYFIANLSDVHQIMSQVSTRTRLVVRIVVDDPEPVLAVDERARDVTLVRAPDFCAAPAREPKEFVRAGGGRRGRRKKRRTGGRRDGHGRGCALCQVALRAPRHGFGGRGGVRRAVIQGPGCCRVSGSAGGGGGRCERRDVPASAWKTQTAAMMARRESANRAICEWNKYLLANDLLKS